MGRRSRFAKKRQLDMGYFRIAKIAKTFFWEFCPLIMVRGINSVLNRVRYSAGESEPFREKEFGWYDNIYERPSDYHEHYTKSKYYRMWNVIAYRIIRSGVKQVLDLGCGPGQFASLLYDKGLKDYCGFDFSRKAIAMAKQRCPSFAFRVVDIRKADILERFNYDCVVALEFLEHVEFDREIIKRIRPGTRFYGTVPNFPCTSHVRYFPHEKEVISRYRAFFSEFQVDTFWGDIKDRVFYLAEGTRVISEFAGKARN